MYHQTFRAIFISDIHLGSKYTNLERLFTFIKRVKTKKIFLVGDIISRDCKRDDKNLEKFIKLLKSKNCEIIFILGNHEEQIENMPPILDELNFHKSYKYRIGKRDALINHGHSYDTKDAFLRALKGIAKKTQVLKKDNPTKATLKRRLHLFLKEIAKVLLHKQFIRYMALKAKKNRCSIVICGHFHIAKHKRVYKVDYYNCGDWISNCSFVGEDLDSNLKLYRVDSTSIKTLK